MNIPDRNTIRTFAQRNGETGAKALFEGVSAQLLKKGFMAQGEKIIDALLILAPMERSSHKENKSLKQKVTPRDWKSIKRRQKDSDASWAKKHGKNQYGYKFSTNVDKKYKVIRKIEMIHPVGMIANTLIMSSIQMLIVSSVSAY